MPLHAPPLPVTSSTGVKCTATVLMSVKQMSKGPRPSSPRGGGFRKSQRKRAKRTPFSSALCAARRRLSGEISAAVTLWPARAAATEARPTPQPRGESFA